jgi:hypothetical protein
VQLDQAQNTYGARFAVPFAVLNFQRKWSKKQKGLETEPLAAKPHFTPSQKTWDITTPGKAKTTLRRSRASALPHN